MGNLKLLVGACAMALWGCGDNANGNNNGGVDAPPVGTTYAIGGTVSGLNGTVVLQNNGGDDVTISMDGSFQFATPVAENGAYTVSVATQPVGQTCTVTSGSGTATSQVMNVAVTCVATTANTWTIGGSVTGLTGNIVLQNNGGDDVALNADGGFTFATAVNDNSAYAVTVFSQPTGQTCTVASGSGTATANVTNVVVTCVTNTTPQYTIGGDVSGLTGTVVLQNNAGDNLSVSSDGAFTFATPIDDATTYAVTVFTQPTNQTCAVTSGSGTVSGANVTNVVVTCTTNTATTFTVGGTITGLVGTVTLQNNGGDDITLSADGAYTFPTALADGAAYSVSALLASQPVGYHCSPVFATASGTIATANVTNADVNCIPAKNIYLTTLGTNGNIGGIAGADAKCASDPSKPNAATFKALLVDQSNRVACTTANCANGSTAEHIDWVMAPNTRYIRPAGTLIGTTNQNGIIPLPLISTIFYGENTNATDRVWTGIFDDWTTLQPAGTDNCVSWSASTSTGGSSRVDEKVAIHDQIEACSGIYKLLCVEQ